MKEHEIYDNKRIAKNTIILYFRLIVITFVGLYTSRVILKALGVDNFGLYSVVGGIVTIMNFLNTTMSATSYRFLAIELGKGEKGNPNAVFNSVLTIHITLSLLFLLLAESFGVWYINNYLNIPHEKIGDALFVFHVSVAGTVFGILNIPFSGLITAKEKFIFTSSIDIISSILKVLFVILISYYLGNRLRAYALLMSIVMLVQPLAYSIYCKVKHEKIVRWKFSKDWFSYKAILNFAWWIMFGAVAYIGQSQGAAIVINWFFGTAINAAFGIATQINTYIMLFVKNLNQATVPQIMKSQSAGDYKHSLSLVYKISKYTFLIMLIPTIPLILSMDSILSIWLDKVPHLTKQFAILMLLNGLVNCLGSGFDAVIQATGKIKKNQIGYSVITLLVLPIAYLLFKLGYPPYTITAVVMGSTISVLIYQTYILTMITDFRISHYLKETLFPSVLVIIFISPLFYLRTLVGSSIMAIIIFTLVTVFSIIIIEYFIGLSKDERGIVNANVKKLSNKLTIKG